MSKGKTRQGGTGGSRSKTFLTLKGTHANQSFPCIIEIMMIKKKDFMFVTFPLFEDVYIRLPALDRLRPRGVPLPRISGGMPGTGGTAGAEPVGSDMRAGTPEAGATGTRRNTRAGLSR